MLWLLRLVRRKPRVFVCGSAGSPREHNQCLLRDASVLLYFRAYNRTRQLEESRTMGATRSRSNLVVQRYCIHF
jgi:hypothetical protein